MPTPLYEVRCCTYRYHNAPVVRTVARGKTKEEAEIIAAAKNARPQTPSHRIRHRTWRIVQITN